MVATMEIKEGFKKTEVGMIPCDWKVTKIGIIADVTKLAGYEYSKYFNSYKDGGEIIVLRGTNITNNILDLSDIKTIPRSTSNNLQRSKLFKNDLVFAYVGTIGPVYLVEEDDRFHLGPNTSKITFKKDYDPQFFLSYFKSWLIKKEIFEHTSIGAQPSLSMSKIRKFNIILPPALKDQTAIATALNDADALITELEKLIAKKLVIKRGAMQELLKPKEGWEVKKLGEVADILTGFPFPSNGYSKVGIRLLRGSNIKRGNTDWKEDICQYWSKITPELMRYCLNVGDIVIAMDGSLVGRSFAQLSDSDLPAILLQRVARVRSTTIDINYLKELICSEMFTAYCDSVKTASAIPHISPTNIYNYKINYPKEKSEQTHIAQILSDMYAEIEVLEKKLEKTKKIKQGMMQELLTGRIRLV